MVTEIKTHNFFHHNSGAKEIMFTRDIGRFYTNRWVFAGSFSTYKAPPQMHNENFNFVVKYWVKNISKDTENSSRNCGLNMLVMFQEKFVINIT